MRGVVQGAAAVVFIAAGVILGVPSAQAQQADVGGRHAGTSTAHPVGIGLALSAQDVSDQPGTRGFGLLIRNRGRGREKELEVSRHRRQGSLDRTVTRIGVNWYVEQADDTWEPYVLFGFGVNVVDVAEKSAGAGQFQVQGYAQGGLGLALRLDSNFTLSADLRASIRRELARENSSQSTPSLSRTSTPAAAFPEFQGGLELQLAAIVYL